MPGTRPHHLFEGHEVRIQQDDHGEPLFVVADICEVLGITNHRDAVAGLDQDEKGVATTDTPGGPQQMLVVTEPGLYALLARSRKPEARRFDRWVRHEVLPAIRRTGSYSAAPAAALDLRSPGALRKLARDLHSGLRQGAQRVANLQAIPGRQGFQDF